MTTLPSSGAVWRWRPVLWVLAVALASACTVEPAVKGDKGDGARASAAVGDSGDLYRPIFHFTPRRHWMNDPNGPVFVAGRYHLFFQHNPGGDVWGNVGWGHATSLDLVRWEEQPMAIPRLDSAMIFSGSVVIDSNGTSGLCAGPNCLVAVYTSANDASKVQSQALAFSADAGTSWQQYRANPVLDIGSPEFRDPYVFWDRRSRQWVMAVAMSKEHRVRFFGSPDLRSWTALSDFGPAGATGGVWECPVLLELPVDGNPDDTRWLLKVDLNPGHVAGGSGGQYFIGHFDGQGFTPSAQPAAGAAASGIRWIDYGRDFYCAQPWTGQRPTDVATGGGVGAAAAPTATPATVWIGWMNNWAYAADLPTTPWRGAMTIPRTLELRSSQQGVQLSQSPVLSLQRLRGERRSFRFAEQVIADPTPLPPEVWGASVELQVTISAGAATEVGLLVRRSNDEHVLIAFDPARRTIALDRRNVRESRFNAAYPSRSEARLTPGAGAVTLRIVVDRSSVELFADEGATVLTSLVFPHPSSTGIALYSKGGAVRSVSVDVWPLRLPAP